MKTVDLNEFADLIGLLLLMATISGLAVLIL